MILYFAPAMGMAIRLLIGWWGAAGLARAARSIQPAPRGLAGKDFLKKVPIRESSSIAVPVTVGLLRPIVLLPSTWREWPDKALVASLVHEMAHVRRRDVLVLSLARLNR